MSEHQCLQLFAKKWPWPFVTPIVFHRDTLELSAGKWFVQANEETQAGNRSTIGAKVQMKFCPFCGEGLMRMEAQQNVV